MDEEIVQHLADELAPLLIEADRLFWYSHDLTWERCSWECYRIDPDRKRKDMIHDALHHYEGEIRRQRRELSEKIQKLECMIEHG